MITMTVRQGPTPKPVPLHQKRSRPVPDIAATCWNDQDWSATSTHGATMVLARKLVAAGCPDQPWQAVGSDGQRRFFGNSLHRLATRTIRESAEGGTPTEAVWVDVSQVWKRDSTPEETETDLADAEP
jgi:hypothetical protein